MEYSLQISSLLQPISDFSFLTTFFPSTIIWLHFFFFHVFLSCHFFNEATNPDYVAQNQEEAQRLLAF